MGGATRCRAAHKGRVQVPLVQVIGSSSRRILPECLFAEFGMLRRVSCRRRLSKISGKEVTCLACGPIRTWTGTRVRGRTT